MIEAVMSNSALIREVIRKAGRPLHMSEIVIRLPKSMYYIAGQHVCHMVRSGVLTRNGRRRLEYTYELGREVKPRMVKTSAEYRASKREAWRKADADRRERSRLGVPAPVRFKSEPKSRVRNPKPIVEKPVQQKRRPLVLESLPVTPAPPATVRQTVEEFLAAGGTIEVLPPSATSSPLLRIGFDDDEGD